MIKGLVFDFGQTLVDSSQGFRLAEKLVQKKICDNLGIVLWDDFIITYRDIRKRFKDVSNFSRNLMWQEVYSFYRCEFDHNLLEKWENEYWDTVNNSTKPFPETFRVLAGLQDTYALGVITNTQGQMTKGGHRISSFPELERFFKTIIIAGESGIAPKPDSLPFRMCLESLGLNGDEVIYVGDDWHIDILGAINAGLNAIWLRHHQVKRNWPEVKITVPVITSLEQLLSMDLDSLHINY